MPQLGLSLAQLSPSLFFYLPLLKRTPSLVQYIFFNLDFISHFFSDTHITNKMDAKKLKSYLECPVCFLVPKAKILACSNGHKICESCFKRLKTVNHAKKCPLGGCDYSNPPHRIRDLEAIVENSDVKLSCSQSACKEEMTRQDLKSHEANVCLSKYDKLHHVLWFWSVD